MSFLPLAQQQTVLHGMPGKGIISNFFPCKRENIDRYRRMVKKPEITRDAIQWPRLALRQNNQQIGIAARGIIAAGARAK